METNKILAALIDHPDISAAQLADITGVNRNTVMTVLQRHEHAVASRRATETGKRGRPEHLYSIKPEWAGVLSRRWEQDSEVRETTALERTLTTLEAASFAAVDPIEAAEERERMVDVAALRVKAARALLARTEDEAVRKEALARIERAELRIAAEPVHRWPVAARLAEPARRAVLAAALRSHWRRWVKQLEALGAEYGAHVIGAAAGRHGIALVIDLIPGNDPVQASLMRALHERRRPAMCVQMGDLSAAKQARFVHEFEGLVLDPIAQFADLYVTIDSQSKHGKAAWARIDDLAHKDHAFQAVKIATDTLMEAPKTRAARPRPIEPVRDFYAHFVKEVMVRVDRDATLWPVYGSPHVLDLRADVTFKAEVERQDWNYCPMAASADLKEVASAQFALEA